VSYKSYLLFTFDLPASVTPGYVVVPTESPDAQLAANLTSACRFLVFSINAETLTHALQRVYYPQDRLVSVELYAEDPADLFEDPDEAIYAIDNGWCAIFDAE